MNTDQLKYFIEVAETEHLTHASENMNISQPALSKAIVRLEDELGVNLFDRNGRNIYLSEAGRLFLPYAISVMRTINDGRKTIKAVVNSNNEMVTIQSFPMIIFPGLFEILLRQYPDATFISSSVSAHLLEENLLTGVTDLCLTQRRLSNNNLNHAILNSESILIVISEKHPLCNKNNCTGQAFL